MEVQLLIGQAIQEWLQYFADQNFNGDVNDVPESWALELPGLLIDDGYTIEQIKSAKGYYFDI